MSEELQKIGLEAVFLLADFLPKADQYTTSLAKINKATYEAVNAMAKSAASTKDVDDKVANFADQLDDTAGAAKLYNERLTEMYRRKEAVKAQTINVVEALHKEGRSFEEIANAMGVSGSQLIKVFQDQGWSIKEIGDATGLTTAQIKEMAEATSTATSYIGRYLKRMALWLTIGAAVRKIVQGITRTLSENIKRLYENTEEWKNYQLQVDRLGLAITAAIAPSGEFLTLLDLIAKGAAIAADGIAAMGAEMWASFSVMGEYVTLVNEWDAAIKRLDFAKAAELAQQINEFQTGTLAPERMAQRRAEYLKGIAEAMALAGKEAVDWAKAEEDLAQILQSSDEELARHAQAISLIHGAYDEEATQIVIDFWAEDKRITQESLAEIAKIEADAADKRYKVEESTARRIRELEARANRDRVNNEKRHQLAMEFARKRYELSVIQNERMYLARRRRLVAEGDVLGIDQLDEDYELQKQAAEENFQLQMEQAEAVARMQARIQEESTQAQIQMLRDAMQEQLREIEAAKQKEIEEAEAAAAAEQELNKQKRDQMLWDAKIAREQELADEAEAHKKRMEAIAKQVVDFAEKYDIESDLIDAVVERHWGKGSAMDKAVQDAFTRYVKYAATAAAYINRIMSGITHSYPSFNYPLGGRPTPIVPEKEQYGTDTVVSKPTLVEVGHGPERLRVDPLSSIGGDMSMSWRGGPIPVHGTGSMDGADTSAIANAIAQSISIEMNKSINRYGGRRTR